MTTGAPVRIRKLSKRYGEHVVFDDVTFTTEQGTVTAIIGPSGAGKSTLLRCMNRLDDPDQGTVEVGDQQYPAGHALGPAARITLRRTVGIVFQSFNLFPHLTVLRNVTIAQQRVLKRSGDEAEEYALRLLESVGLKAKAHDRPATLSGGQQQRVAIARALALDPQVLLFDEPTSALDPELGQEVLAVMRDLAGHGRTMIVVTHEMRFAREISDQVVVMADGGAIEIGPPTKIFGEPCHERTRRFLHTVLDR